MANRRRQNSHPTSALECPVDKALSRLLPFGWRAFRPEQIRHHQQPDTRMPRVVSCLHWATSRRQRSRDRPDDSRAGTQRAHHQGHVALRCGIDPDIVLQSRAGHQRPNDWNRRRA